MSYANVQGNASGRAAVVNRFVMAGGIALLQAGIVVALINGFAVDFIPGEPDRPLESEFIEMKLPPPPPQAVPTPEPQVAPSQSSQLDVVPPRVLPPRPDVPRAAPVPKVPAIDPGFGAGVGDGPVVTITPPSVPSASPSYTPLAAAPRNSAAGWVTTQDYPVGDLRRGNQGRVGFVLSIDTAGRVTDCRVTDSSGHGGLDAAACKTVTKRARFRPATNAMGEKVAGTYASSVRWVIPRD